MEVDFIQQDIPADVDQKYTKELRLQIPSEDELRQNF